MSKINFFKKRINKISFFYPKFKFINDLIINDIKPLKFAKKNDLTFYDSKKYQELSSKTKLQALLVNFENNKLRCALSDCFDARGFSILDLRRVCDGGGELSSTLWVWHFVYSLIGNCGPKTTRNMGFIT